MNKRTVIILCGIIVILLGIVTAGICCLYSDARTDTPVAVDEAGTEVDDLADTIALDDVPEPVATPESAPKQEAVPAASVKVPEGPFSVKNSSTGKQNTLRQNKDNSIELLDEKGQSLWKKSMNGKLCGMVGEVDFFHNNKIQYLMVEGRNVHLIDRLGREVSGFPRQLASKAILGPEKCTVKGTNYWHVKTEGGDVWLNLPKDQILNKLPE